MEEFVHRGRANRVIKTLNVNNSPFFARNKALLNKHNRSSDTDWMLYCPNRGGVKGKKMNKFLKNGFVRTNTNYYVYTQSISTSIHGSPGP